MSTARPLTEGASGADASKPTTAMVPSEVPSSGIATWSQPSSGCSAAAVERGAREPVLDGAVPDGVRFSRVASNSVVCVVGLGEVEVGQLGLEHQAHHAVVQPRGDQGGCRTSTVWVTSGAAGSETSTVTSSVAAPVAAPVGTPLRDRDHGVAGQQDLGAVRARGPGQVERGEPLDLGTAHVVGDQVAVLDPEQRAPSVLTTSGSSTPASCTLVPVSPFVERTGRRAPAARHRCAHRRRRRPSSRRSRRRCWGCRPTRRGRPGPRRARRTTPAGRRRTPRGVRSQPEYAAGRGVRPRAPAPRPGPGVVGAAVRRAGDEGGAEADHGGERDEGAGDGAGDGGAQGMAGPSGVDLEVAGASALISGVR